MRPIMSLTVSPCKRRRPRCRIIGDALKAVDVEALHQIGNIALAKAEEIESRGERERLARAAESKRLKEEALSRVRERANKSGS